MMFVDFNAKAMSYIEKMEERGVPEAMHEPLNAYIMTGRPVGGFLTSVLCNDLKNTFMRADSTNIRHVFNFVDFLYNDAPMACWGSITKMQDWATQGGLQGVDK